MLENNLIKEYRPRFNVRLKDDKSYPSIAVTLDEPFPRVLVTRRPNIPGARYFGPYTDVGQLRRTLAIIRRLYTVRSCHDELPEERRDRPCLDYHIGRCQAPCVGWQTEPTIGRWWMTWSSFSRAGPAIFGPRYARRCWPRASAENYERARELRDALRWLEKLEEPWRWRSSVPETRTRSASPATVMTRWRCSCGCARDGWWVGTIGSWRAWRRRPTPPS